MLGKALNPSVDLGFQGARAAANGAVDLATLPPPVPAAEIDALDGYRFIRVTVQLSSGLPSPPSAALGAIPPRREDLSIPWSAPLGCSTP